MHSEKIEQKQVVKKYIYIKSYATIRSEKLMKPKNYVRFVRHSHIGEIVYPQNYKSKFVGEGALTSSSLAVIHMMDETTMHLLT